MTNHRPDEGRARQLRTLTHEAGSQTHNIPACQALSTSFSLSRRKKKESFFLSVVATVAHGPWLHDKHIPAQREAPRLFQKTEAAGFIPTPAGLSSLVPQECCEYEKKCSYLILMRKTHDCAKVGSESDGGGEMLKIKQLFICKH